MILNKRVMVTVNPNESLKHLSNYIGHLMQKYSIFQNLLGLKAIDFKIVKTQSSPKIYKIDEEMGEIALDKQTLFIKQSPLEEDQYDKPISSQLRDGDEFVFSISSFDKWIKIIAVYELDGEPKLTFSTKLEMRVGNYYPNSHFFNLIQKLVINVWNEHITQIRDKKDYYILKDISFWNKKTINSNLDQEYEQVNRILNDDSQSNSFIKMSWNIKRELAKVHLTKKNYIEVPINPENKVEDTFGYDGCIVVEVKFSSLSNEISLWDTPRQNKVDHAIAGCIILEKLQTNIADLSSGHIDNENVDSFSKEILKLKKYPTELNPFSKYLFKFNKNKRFHKQHSDQNYDYSIDEIKEQNPYMHASFESDDKNL